MTHRGPMIMELHHAPFPDGPRVVPTMDQRFACGLFAFCLFFGVASWCWCLLLSFLVGVGWLVVCWGNSRCDVGEFAFVSCGGGMLCRLIAALGLLLALAGFGAGVDWFGECLLAWASLLVLAGWCFV